MHERDNNYLNKLSNYPVTRADFVAKNWDLMVVAYSPVKTF